MRRVHLKCKNIHDEDVLVEWIEYKNTGVTTIYASGRKLVKMPIPHGTTEIFCDGNHLTELFLPDTVRTLWCDPELFDYDKCLVKNVKIYYK